MNNRSRYTRIFYSSKVTNIQFFQINLHRFKKSHPIFTANRSGVLRESNFHPVFTRYPSSCSRSRVTGTGQCIVDVHTKKTTGAFFFTRFLSPHFFFSSLFIYLSFFSLSFNKHLNTNVNGNGFVSFETESENFGTIILQGNQWPLACMLVHPYMYNKSIKTSSFSLLTILYLYIYIFFFPFSYSYFLYRVWNNILRFRLFVPCSMFSIYLTIYIYIYKHPCKWIYPFVSLPPILSTYLHIYNHLNAQSLVFTSFHDYYNTISIEISDNVASNNVHLTRKRERNKKRKETKVSMYRGGASGIMSRAN